MAEANRYQTAGAMFDRIIQNYQQIVQQNKQLKKENQDLKPQKVESLFWKNKYQNMMDKMNVRILGLGIHPASSGH